VKRGTPCGGLLAILGLAASAAHADIYAYTDATGTAHFSNIPDDPRYELIVRSPVPVEPEVTPGPQESAGGFLRRSNEYDASISAAAADAGLPPALVRAVIVVESGFNPRAISRRGAIGLMQLLPATARRYGAFNAFDPDQNIRAGTKYLAELVTRFGSDRLELVLAAYNAGEGAVERYGRRIPPFRETRAYVPNVLRMYRALLAQTVLVANGGRT